MINRKQIDRAINKVRNLDGRYRKLVSKKVFGPLDTEYQETFDNLYTPPKSGYDKISCGDKWGGPWVYAWFKTSFTVPEELAGKDLWLEQETNAVECLVYINGKCVGEFDNCSGDNPLLHLHRRRLITKNAKAGETFEIALEGYSGHLSTGTQPEDVPETDPQSIVRTFNGLYITELDEEVDKFLMDLRIMNQLFEILPEDSFRKWKVAACLEELFAILPQRPETEASEEEWRPAIKKACEVMAPIFEEKNGPDAPYAGLIGHSHLDTVWLWPMAETVRKAARTFSNALHMMELYPEYTFIASSNFHYDWMRRFYPDVFEGIKARVAEGRWEPNGGSWVEVDGNMASGELMIRQFVKGQRFNREHFGLTADSFWLPDTFGYSAAIPQIMKGCGMKYFLTTKLSWNDTNRFPYDTFVWRGIDGSEVLTHFNMIHFWPDALGLKTTVYNNSLHKKVTDMKLCSYGFGDGGGGPSRDMIEASRITKDLNGVPKSEHTTVSKFMKKLEETSKDVPIFDGELYVEGHRGTLTNMHEIKRGNRKSEIALRNLEAISVIADSKEASGKPESIDELYELFLPNQFHDILPGSSIARVHDEAIAQMGQVISGANNESKRIAESLTDSADAVTAFNTLSWDRTSQLTVDGTISAEGYDAQNYTDVCGRAKTAIGGLSIGSLSSISFKTKNSEAPASASSFKVNGNIVETPFALVTFDENGFISSFIDKDSKRELRAENSFPLNTFLAGDDIPNSWDNWDIDADLALKLSPCANLISREIVSDGKLQLRIRSTYSIPRNSTLTQDIVFYNDTPKVDFESVINWNDPHRFLKTAFKLNVLASTVKSEVQYGHLDRMAFRGNNEFEQARFEVCNHKWTDISENKFGVSILNDCKYGISINGNELRLSLHKGGMRPDTRGDVGIHEFTYSLLPHNSGFNAENVIHPAYELNIQPILAKGSVKSDIKPLLEISQPNIICEALKFAEDNDGYVARLYEAEKAGVNVRIKPNFNFKKAAVVNMLEDYVEDIIIDSDGTFELPFRAFEIKTIKFYK